MCLNPFFLRILYLSKVFINILRFIVPLGLIFKTILDVYKQILNPNDKESLTKIRNRAIAAVIVFIVPTLVNLIISFITKVSDTDINGGLAQCLEFANVEYIEKLEKNLDEEELNGYLDESAEYLTEYQRRVEAIRIMVQESQTPTIGEYQGDKKVIACGSGSQYNEKLFSMVRSAGPKTRNGVVAAAVYLSSHIDVNIPYFWSGGHNKQYVGLNDDWGCGKKMPPPGTSAQIPGKEYPNGLDCSGFVGWAILNGGYYTGSGNQDVVPATRNESGYFTSLGGISLPHVSVSEAKGKIKPGDIATKKGHVGMVVEVSDSGFKVAEERGKNYGLVITDRSYSSKNGFTFIVQMDKFYENYKKDSDLWETFK